MEMNVNQTSVYLMDNSTAGNASQRTILRACLWHNFGCELSSRQWTRPISVIHNFNLSKMNSLNPKRSAFCYVEKPHFSFRSAHVCRGILLVPMVNSMSNGYHFFIVKISASGARLNSSNTEAVSDIIYVSCNNFKDGTLQDVWVHCMYSLRRECPYQIKHLF